MILPRKRIDPRAENQANGFDCVQSSLSYSKEERQIELSTKNEFITMINDK